MPLEHKRRPVRVRVLSQDGQIPGLLPRPWQALHVASLPPRFSYHPSSCRPNSLSSPRPRRVGRERTACAEAKTKEPKKKPPRGAGALANGQRQRQRKHEPSNRYFPCLQEAGRWEIAMPNDQPLQPRRKGGVKLHRDTVD